MSKSDRIYRNVGQNSNKTAWQRITNALRENNRIRALARKVNKELNGIDQVESFAQSNARMLDQVINMIRVQSQVDSRITPRSFLIRLKRDPVNEGTKNDPLLIIEALKQNQYGRIYDIIPKGKNTYLITIKQI